MRRFIRNSIIIFVSMIFFIGVFEIVFKNHINFVDHRFNEYFKEKDSVDVIFIGNSHMQALKNLSINYCKSFNFSFGGQDIFHMFVILKTITQEKNSLKVVIMAVDYDLLGYDYRIANMMWQDRLYYKPTKILYDSSFANVLMAKSNFFLANRNFKNIITKRDREVSSIVDMTFVDLASPCEKRAFEHSYVKYNKELISTNLYYLKKISDLLSKNNIKLIMINLPKRECYYEYYIKEVTNLGNNLLQNFCIEHNIIFVDFWRDTAFTNEDFIDNDHLNINGSAKVINVLSSKLMQTSCAN
jgi:hypothetical protein